MGEHPVADPPSVEYIEPLEEQGISVNLDADIDFAIPDDFPIEVDTYTWEEDNRHQIAEMWDRQKDDYDDVPGFMQELRDPPGADALEPRQKTRIAFGEPVRICGDNPLDGDALDKVTVSSTHMISPVTVTETEEVQWSESMVLSCPDMVSHPRNHKEMVVRVMFRALDSVRADLQKESFEDA